jgi:hypothetical protein
MMPKVHAVFGRPSCSKLLESVTDMSWAKFIQDMSVTGAGGLITWAHRFAAKKWLFLAAIRCGRADWTSAVENGPHLSNGKTGFSDRPTRAFGRTGRD